MKHLLIVGHILDALSNISPESIDLIVTSPPYFGLRNYGEGSVCVWDANPECEHDWSVQVGKGGRVKREQDVDPKFRRELRSNNPMQQIYSYFCSKCGGWRGQLGSEPTLQLYLNHMLQITQGLHRVLKPSGSFYLNIGDSYSGSNGAGGDYGSGGRREGQEGGYAVGDSGVPRKSMCDVPHRLAIRMVDEQRWIKRNSVIWEKTNAMPSSVQDRFSCKYEYVFFFTKSPKYYFNLDAVRIPHQHPNEVAYRKQLRRGRRYNSKDPYRGNMPYGGKFTGMCESEAEGFGSPRARNLRKQDNVPGRNNSTYKGFNERWRADTHEGRGKNPGDVWHIPTKPNPLAHWAIFPERLVKPPILSSSPPLGVVLDPFGGSGTTAVAARELGRNSICVEVNQQFEPLWRQRLCVENRGLDSEYEVKRL